MGTLGDIKQAVLDMQPERVEELVGRALESGSEAMEIMNDALIPAMDIVGSEYEAGERYIPEMLMASEAMRSGMELLRPLLAEQGVKPVGTAVLGTVEGDLHDIGKNLVAMMLEGAGLLVVNLGIDVPADAFAAAVREHHPDLLGMSALLTTTMVRMRGVIETLDNEGLRDGVKVMIGGAPVTQAYADEIGAEGYAPDAATAVKKARELLGLDSERRPT